MNELPLKAMLTQLEQAMREQGLDPREHIPPEVYARVDRVEQPTPQRELQLAKLGTQMIEVPTSQPTSRFAQIICADLVQRLKSK